MVDENSKLHFSSQEPTGVCAQPGSSDPEIEFWEYIP